MKRLLLRRSLLTLLVGFVILSTATAQTATDPNEGSRLTYDSLLGTYDFSWWGQPGRTYFIQHSDDLLAWEYLPLIESGTDALRAWGFTSTASKFFLRLRFSDIPTSDPFTADFDGDKVSNYDELLFGTDPLVSLDSDLDGLPDDWEKWHFGNLASAATGDPDNDGLSNLEEFAHGTNPKSPDSDFDGLSDGAEVNIHGTDPLKWDSDGDTLPDGWEVQYGLHPLDPADANQTAAGGGMTNLQHYELGSNPNNPPPPPTITAGTATLDQSADTLLYPADDSQLLLKNGNFSAPALSPLLWDTFGGITGWTALSGSLVELQQITVNTTAGAGQYCELDAHWPTVPHLGPSDHGIQQTVELARGRYVLFFDYRGRNATARSFTVKARTGISLPGLPQPIEYLLATENAASTTAWKRASTTFEVTGGNPNLATLPITLIFDIADAADSYGAYIDNVLLLPVEILDKDKKAVSKLKVGKMAETGVLTGSGSSTTLDIDKDSDRFYVRIPRAGSMGAVSIKVGTVENPDASYNDDETEIDLQVDGNDLITKSILLVADDVDDDHQVDGIADDAKNDRTHKIQLGGKFQIKSVKIAGAEHATDIKTPAPAKKTVSVNVVILRDRVEATGGTPVISEASVEEAWKIANERYAQVGVRVNVTGIVVKDPPVGVDLTDGSVTVSSSAEARPLAWETKNLIRFLGTEGNSSDIHVFYVTAIEIGSDPDAAGGIALADFFYSGTDPAYTYNILLKAHSSMPWAGYAAAHELGHLLTNAGHRDANNVLYPNWHLMFEGLLQTNGILGSRRLNVSNEATIQGNPHSK